MQGKITGSQHSSTPFLSQKGQKSRIRSWFTASPGERNALEDFASFRSEYPGGKYATDFPQTHNPHCL